MQGAGKLKHGFRSSARNLVALYWNNSKFWKVFYVYSLVNSGRDDGKNQASV